MSAEAGKARRLRVGLVIGGSAVPAWVTLLLEDLGATAGLQLAGVITVSLPATDRATPERSAYGSRVFASIDERVFGDRATHLRCVHLPSWAGAHGVTVTEISRLADTRGVAAWDSGPSSAPHVILDLAYPPEAPAIGSTPHSEVWWLEGVPTGGSRDELVRLSAAVIRRAQVVSFRLCALLSGGESVVLATATCPVHPTSPLMTGEYMAASARQLIAAKLANATPESITRTADGVAAGGPRARAGGDSAAEGALAGPLSSPQGTSSAAGSWRAAPGFALQLARRQVAKAVLEPQWQLLLGRQGSDRLLPDPTRLQAIVPPPGSYWADPFAISHDGVTHVFFEEFLYRERKGRIAVTTLDRRGRPGPVQLALELETHLSYPCVFCHEGRLFMVPESAATGSLDLYECMEPPGAWIHRRTLLTDVQLVDASVVAWGGLWWLFASLKKPRGLRTAELLKLYFTDDPISGVWREHPSSPLLADVTGARPAGAPFVHGDRLYRLAQDGSGGYGWAIAVSEVVRLSTSDFADRRVARLTPSWTRGACGTHTLNRSGNLVVMDVCRAVLHHPLRPRANGVFD